jgi:rhamnogalacturonyl hydrolase YesR
VVNYDTITGKVTSRGTHQGYADNTAWARGQAWGIYGFTTMYRETQDIKYLNLAKNMSDFYLTHPNMPNDLVPYWDFNDPEIPNNVPRDASAAAIVASGLLEMSTYLGQEGKTYFSAAEKIIQSLSTNYRTNAKDKHSFILKHSVGNKPKNAEVDVPLNYADYYYLEALLRFNQIKNK